MKLFEDDDNDVCSAEEDISKIEINNDFARRYAHNKKREDLMRLTDLKKRGRAGVDEDDMSSSDDSDSDYLTNPKKLSEFVDVLIKVKNQHPSLKEENAKLFNDEENEPGLEKRAKKGGKPKYLKDVTAELLLVEGPEFDDKADVKTYVEEQEGLRRGIVEATDKAMDDVASEGDLFKVKDIEGEVAYDDDMADVGKKLDEYFGKDDDLDENEVFLKKFIRNKMWVGEDKDERVAGEDGIELSDDEEAIEKQEDYERGFNFRFEENAGDRVMGHSRVVEGSVRKKTNARKAQRESKAEREAQAERERKEELKRLKNVKKREMREKLAKIKETAGVEGGWVCPLDEDDLEDEFDPVEHDRKMREAFNDEYYGAEDADPEFKSDEEGELEKPDFGKEDELLGLGNGWDEVSGSKDGFLAIREKVLKRKAENEGYLEKIVEEGEKEEAEGDVKEGKRKKKRKLSKMEKEVVEKELEEYYKLDYEGTIGDLKTRFKYKEVGQRSYGLNTEAILALDDKELNQHVSMKKLAPYREKEWKVDRNKMLTQKQRIKLLLKGKKLDDQKNDKNMLKIEDNKSEDEEIKGGTIELSKKQRRKLGEAKRKAEFQLTDSRLYAYGKEIHSKSKSKKKN